VAIEAEEDSKKRKEREMETKLGPIDCNYSCLSSKILATLYLFFPFFAINLKR